MNGSRGSERQAGRAASLMMAALDGEQTGDERSEWETLLRQDPNLRAEWKRIVNARYGWVDLPTFQASIRGSECVEGFRAFIEKRPPSWVPNLAKPDGEA